VISTWVLQNKDQLLLPSNIPLPPSKGEKKKKKKKKNIPPTLPPEAGQALQRGKDLVSFLNIFSRCCNSKE
jgi:hypothetical protein